MTYSLFAALRYDQRTAGPVDNADIPCGAATSHDYLALVV